MISVEGKSQEIFGGNVHGSFQMDAQYYNEDTLIGATKPDEKMAANSFLNVIYTNKDFEAGIRYEAFTPAIMGFDQRYNGSGIAYRYAKYSQDHFEITAGNFYEQFGSGMILRAYQEWNLGFDNSLDGIRIKDLLPGIRSTGLVGKQRIFWGKGDGTVRGIDAEFQLNDMLACMKEMKTRYILGANFVSRYQKDLDPIYKLPANVGAYSGRIAVFHGNYNFNAEAAYKINDPNSSNNMIYKPGNAVLLSLGYSKKGIGFTLQAKRVDNMDFRSDRNATGFNLPIGYIPAMSTQHAYSLPAYYPSASQANGEMGLQANFDDIFKKNGKIGGKEGMGLSMNYSVSQSINKSQINDTIPIGLSGTDGYKSSFFDIGNEKYYHDFNVKISKKINKKWMIEFSYVNIFYNVEINEGHKEPNILAQSGVVDLWWKFKPYNSLHFDQEAMFTAGKGDGNWELSMLEYSHKSYFAAIIDLYNYGNPVDYLRLHYLSFSTGYTWNTSRLSITVGKQNSGIICIGGVCRQVPATNGISLSLSSSF